MRQKQRVFSLFLLSPSSRRAWIEIAFGRIATTGLLCVALLAEGVDIHCHCLDPRSAVRNSRSLPMI